MSQYPCSMQLVQKDEHLSIPAAVYAGIQVEHDRLLVIEKCGSAITTHESILKQPDATTGVLDWLKSSARERHLHYIAVVYKEDERLNDLLSRLWLKEDIVPFVVTGQDSAYHLPLEELVREIAFHFDEENVVQPVVSAEREVQPSELVTLADYERVTPPNDYKLLRELARDFQGKKLVFINATPRGGGVALMRHALIRLLRLLHVDAHWYNLVPKQEVFDVTKTKFHNVLQGVASPEAVLTEEEKDIYNAWIRENAQAMEGMFRQADVIVIDDPQPSGLIPYIKEANPAAKIIYRSHIQLEGALASQEGTPQHVTWSFLWDKIRHADSFISHPMSMFVPDNVPPETVLYMPATTDPLDGLNKPLTPEQRSTYMELFNALLVQAGQTPLDEHRPYIVQIARFDPSKGIPDVLDAYRQVRAMLEEQHKVIPQLVITGNGSIDDPDGVPIYTLIWNMLQSEPYASFANDIKVVRLPHRDQILNMLLRESAVALQLSIKEGFEVKVTEALMKGKPMIAYHVGGIPLQIENGINGYLVEEVGNTTKVAQHLYDLLTDENLYTSMCQAAEEYAKKEYLTVPNAICWLYLAVKLVNEGQLEGHHQWVKALAERERMGETAAA
jgi:alpha,alpha-trehalose phosphorylase (configuration-retaining)